MRFPLIAGNWKMHHTVSETRGFLEDFLGLYAPDTSVEVAIAPAFTALPVASDALRSTSVALAAQNMCWEPQGAYTGEVSPIMLKELGCQYVILGHSERRHYFSEDNKLINQKILSALTHDLSPIFCVGESLAERESGQTHSVIEVQLLEGLFQVTQEQMNRVTIAYEPVWAIGTGKAATVEQASEVHANIRQIIVNKWGLKPESLRIIYGGSVSPDNATTLFQSSEINGALVGKACLNPDSFVKIVSCAQQVKRALPN